MNEETPGMISMMRALNKIERDNRSYQALSAAYDKWYREYEPRATSSQERTWLRQVHAMRRFGLAVQFERPVSEREDEFQALSAVGFPSNTAQFLILSERARYMADCGDAAGTAESIQAMKRVAEATTEATLPSDWREVISKLEQYRRSS